METLSELMDEVRSKNVSYGFVTHWKLNWQLNYLADQTMIFRQFYNIERCQEYIDAVNECYIDSLCPIILVGYNLGNISGCPRPVVVVKERFFLMENPKEECLLAADFQLPGR